MLRLVTRHDDSSKSVESGRFLFDVCGQVCHTTEPQKSCTPSAQGLPQTSSSGKAAAASASLQFEVARTPPLGITRFSLCCQGWVLDGVWKKEPQDSFLGNV